MNLTKIRNALVPILAGVAIAAAPLSALAAPYSSMYIFGDSLSDTGNTQIVTGGAFPDPAQPYVGGRFSNGPLWVEDLAGMLGLPTITTTQSLFGGNNFAFAGARLVGGGLPTLIQQAVANRQLGNILAPGVLPNFAPITSFDPNALYVVVGGGNDMRDARTAFGSNSLTDQTGRQAAAVAAVTSLTQTVGYLASHGAKNVLISNIPDLGYTPEAVLLGLQAASSDATSRFNALLPSIFGLETLIPGLNIELLDMAGVSATVRNNPGAYGIANTFLPCDGFTGSDALVGFGIGPFACNVSSFSDALHPSARSHQLIAEAAFHLVPEPTSLALFGLAFAGLVWAQRRKVAVRAV